jgi:hypothetical protein
VPGRSQYEVRHQPDQIVTALVEHVVAAARQSHEPGVGTRLGNAEGAFRHGDDIEKSGHDQHRSRAARGPFLRRGGVTCFHLGCGEGRILALLGIHGGKIFMARRIHELAL